MCWNAMSQYCLPCTNAFIGVTSSLMMYFWAWSWWETRTTSHLHTNPLLFLNLLIVHTCIVIKMLLAQHKLWCYHLKSPICWQASFKVNYMAPSTFMFFLPTYIMHVNNAASTTSKACKWTKPILGLIESLI